MPANTNPIFGLTPYAGALATVRIATANTNRDGTGTLGTIVTAGANGARVERIRIMATATTTAGMIRFYISDGTNIRLWDEVTVSALTPSATVLGFKATLSAPDPYGPLLLLPAAYLLRASTHNAESFDITVVGADF